MAGRDPKAGTSLTNVAAQPQVQHEKCIGINAPCLDEQSIYIYTHKMLSTGKPHAIFVCPFSSVVSILTITVSIL